MRIFFDLSRPFASATLSTIVYWHLCVQAILALPVTSPDTSLATFPVASYGARWGKRNFPLLQNMSRMQIVILMQEDGVCWTNCCPEPQMMAQCGTWHNGSALPNCNYHCDQVHVLPFFGWQMNFYLDHPILQVNPSPTFNARGT